MSRQTLKLLIDAILTLILFTNVSSQSCSDTHNVSTMISYSIHGQSVNDYIGATLYNNIIKEAATAFTQSSANQKVGVTAFGGINGGDSIWELLSLQSGDGTDVSTAIDGFTPDYSNNYGNTASEAIATAIDALEGETERQKYHIIFSATIPLSNGFGQGTTPSYIDDICTLSVTAKQKSMFSDNKSVYSTSDHIKVLFINCNN